MPPSAEATLKEGPFEAGLLEAEPESIAEALHVRGLWMSEGALRTDYVDRLRDELDFTDIRINANGVGVVHAADQAFISHVLATSKRAFDIITSAEVRAICQAYFQGKPFKLTNQRIYQTHTAAHMPWHTDNNQQVGGALSAKHQLGGLLFLAYLSDVTENPLQVLRDSHRWSRQHTDVYFSDRFVEENYADEVVSFRCSRGALMICDIHLVHRAEPFRNRNYARETLLFQVDAVDPTMEGHGERLLVNTAFVTDRSPEVLDFLGMGMRADYPFFPATSVETMTPKALLNLQRKLWPQMFRAMGKTLLKKVLPGAWIINFKRLRWRFRSKKESDPDVR